jgi:thiamine kinase-like enzyme
MKQNKLKVNEVKKIIQENYNIEGIENIEKLSIEASHVFFKITCENGKKYFFKEEYKKKDLENKIQDKKNNEILNFFSKTDLKLNIPLQTKLGSFLVKKTNKTSYNYYYLYKYLYVDKNNENIQKHEIEIAIKEFANFHKETKKFKSKYFEKEDTNNYSSATAFHVPNQWYHTSIIDEAKKVNTEFSEKVLKISDLIKNLHFELLHYQHKLTLTEPQLIHYDFNPGNIFFKEGNFLCISDFEYSTFGPVQRDIVKAARFWASKEDKFDFEFFIWFIKKYQKHSDVEINNVTIFYLTCFIITRRIVFAAHMTLTNTIELEFLFDKDIRDLKELVKHKDELVSYTEIWDK